MKKKQGTSTKADKLSLLKSQMKDMSQDYQDMIKAREEAKKQLGKRFADVYSQIEENKQFTESEGNRVMATLNAFQRTFETKLELGEKAIAKEITAEKKKTSEMLVDIDKKIDALDKALEEEKKERIRQTEEALTPIRKDLDDLKDGFEQEANERSAKEVEMLKKLETEAANLIELIEKHKKERIARITEVREETKDELKLQSHYINLFEVEATGKFSKLRADLENEMSNRFNHQDEMIDNLQKVIGQFQGTLKIFGKNV